MFESASSLQKILWLGACFTVLFSADTSFSYAEKPLTSAIKEDDSSYNLDGYVSLGLVYFMYAISLWLAPSALALFGIKLCMWLGSLGYIAHLTLFMGERVWLTYTSMVLAGIGGSLLWVSQGSYLLLTSSAEALPSLTGLFWVCYTSSMILGNGLAALLLHGKDTYDKATRRLVVGVLSIVATVGSCMFLLLPSPGQPQVDLPASTHTYSVKGALKETWNVLKTRQLLTLIPIFIHTGFQQSFGSSVYGACMSFTNSFSKQTAAMAGVSYGAGELSAGFLQMGLARYNLVNRSRMVALCILAEFTSFILIAFNLADSSVFGKTSETTPLGPSVPIALFCSWLIGVGDCLLNTQIYPLLGSIGTSHSSQLCALYKFVKSMAMAGYFVLNLWVSLRYQLILMTISGVIGSSLFYLVDSNLLQSQTVLESDIEPIDQKHSSEDEISASVQKV